MRRIAARSGTPTAGAEGLAVGVGEWVVGVGSGEDGAGLDTDAVASAGAEDVDGSAWGLPDRQPDAAVTTRRRAAA
jgi:hypothetical protein